ncbi:MAG: hypothetical protein IT359_12180 [Gemmatimonadaceae bacterium]|nr:hypothetical protein [Gemmatimonadaceae bacterium]
MMFRAMLRAQWIWSRSIMWFFLAAAFSLPLLLVPMTTVGYVEGAGAASFVQGGETLGMLVAITVALAAIALTLQGWSADDRGRHVYALSLPVERHHYLAYRLGGGFLMLGAIAGAVWIGALLSASLLDLPESLSAYPTALASRALLAAWLVHTVSFLFRFGVGPRARAATFWFVVVLAVLLLLPIGSLPGRLQLMQAGARALVQPHGPLGILVSRWSFIDV